MPVGTTMPARPSRGDDLPGQPGEDGVGVDVAASGQREAAGVAQEMARGLALAQGGGVGGVQGRVGLGQLA